MKKLIEKTSYQNRLILTALLLTVILVAGIQFFVEDFPRYTPKLQEKSQFIEEAQVTTPLVRKDTFTIRSENPPYITWASFDPLDYEIGETQVVEVKIENELPVEKVGVTIITDNQEKVHELELVYGTAEKGTWRGSWVAEDSKDFRYQAVLNAESAAESSEVVITFR